MPNNKIKIAINGFGRIGRAAFKVALDKSNIGVAAINDLGEIENLAYLLKYDSAYGSYNKKIKIEGDFFIIGDKKIKVFSEKNPSALPWKELGIEVVLECSGFFTDREGAGKHLKAGAKKVIISAPTKDKSIKTIVIGVNDKEIASQDDIVANASCTTNCLAPMIKVLDENFGVEKSLMSTIHSYTATQMLVDGPGGKKDMRRGRAAAESIIPSSTGAAIATTLTLPQLEGKFDGIAYRVPTLVGSISDLVAVIKKEVSEEEINEAFRKASQSSLKGIMEISDDLIVSRDIVGNPHSVIIDSALTKVIGGNLIKAAGWYDNEWGYANRLVELIEKIFK